MVKVDKNPLYGRYYDPNGDHVDQRVCEVFDRNVNYR